LKIAPSSAIPAIEIKKRGPIGPAQIDRKHDHQIGRDHREFALRKIDDAGRAKNQDEAQRDKRVDGADSNSREEQLQKEIHAAAPSDGPSHQPAGSTPLDGARPRKRELMDGV
jgi:hypothetical protein